MYTEAIIKVLPKPLILIFIGLKKNHKWKTTLLKLFYDSNTVSYQTCKTDKNQRVAD